MRNFSRREAARLAAGGMLAAAWGRLPALAAAAEVTEVAPGLFVRPGVLPSAATELPQLPAS